MGTKKQRRTIEVKSRRKKRTKRNLMLYVVSIAIVGFLVFFFVTLFNYFYPATGSKTSAKPREKEAVMLYFSDAGERYLVGEKRYVPRQTEGVARAREITQALLGGSKAGLVNTFPTGVTVQSVQLGADGTVQVSFSTSLIKDHPGGTASEVATVYSLTNTLAENIPAIKKVRILVDGEPVATIKGHLDLGQPFAPNRDLLAPVPGRG